ncbi:COG4223 family protein [Yoonia sp.]|uniref:COG4223 family protein n=1 Tax=Yoonia sp. TaxID=2212373 RepID=UPI002FD9FF0E
MVKQPAKSRKAVSDGADPTHGVADAVESASTENALFDAIPPEVRPTSDLPAPDRVAPAMTPTEAVETPDKPAVAPDPAPRPSAPPAPKVASGGGFLPLTLGGLLAGVIGYGVATLTTPASDNGLSVQLAQQSAAIAALEERIDAAPQVDVSGIETAVAERIETVLSEVAALTARIDALEARPEVVVAPDPEAGAAVTAEMDALRRQLAEMAAAAQAELEDARAAAAAIEQSATAAARNAASRAALARVQTALDSGAPIGAALGDLEATTGEAAPDALLAVVDGVPTLPVLQDRFPDAARAALATARSEGVAGEETSGIGAFLRNQFDVRSTAPREGDSADAVLSRAEAALRGGRLSDALAELAALPEVARAEMSGWLTQAEARADAVAAVDILSSSLSDN